LKFLLLICDYLPGKLNNFCNASEDFVCCIAIYDLIIAGHDIDKINVLKMALSEKFDMTDLGRAKNLLGIEIRYLEDESIFLHQTRYIEEILKKYGMEDCNPSHTPMDHLVPGNGISFDTKEYQRVTGSLMWPVLEAGQT
jgi:hypothetical protein